MSAPQRKPPTPAAGTDPFGALRAEIDAVDAELVRLFARRFKVVALIGAEKAKRGMPVRVPERIAAVEARVRKLAAESGLEPEIAGRLWQAIIDEACTLEESTHP